MAELSVHIFSREMVKLFSQCVTVFSVFQCLQESSQLWWEWDTRSLESCCLLAFYLGWGQSSLSVKFQMKSMILKNLSVYILHTYSCWHLWSAAYVPQFADGVSAVTSDRSVTGGTALTGHRALCPALKGPAFPVSIWKPSVLNNLYVSGKFTDVTSGCLAHLTWAGNPDILSWWSVIYQV